MASTPAAQTHQSGVFLIAERPLCRFGMAQLISDQPDLAVCGQADDVERAKEVLKESGATAAVLDISGLPAAADAVRSLHQDWRDLPVLVVAAQTDQRSAMLAIRAGAKGFITNREDASQFVEAVRKVIGGQVYLSPVFSEQLVKQLAQDKGDGLQSPIDRLTDRETEVLRLLGTGHTTREIAATLALSIKTVEAHRAHIREKLGMRTGPDLLRFAMDWVKEQ